MYWLIPALKYRLHGTIKFYVCAYVQKHEKAVRVNADKPSGLHEKSVLQAKMNILALKFGYLGRYFLVKVHASEMEMLYLMRVFFLFLIICFSF